MMKHLLMSAAVAAVAMTANATVVTVWQGNQPFSSWGNSISVSKDAFSKAAVGDKIVAGITVDLSLSAEDYAVLIFKNGATWGDLPGEGVAQNPQEGDTACSYTLTEETLQIVQSNGLIIQGLNFIANDIKLDLAADFNPNLLFEGNQALDWWPGIEMSRDVFATAAAGDKLEIAYTNAQAGGEVKLRAALNWQNTLLPAMARHADYQEIPNEDGGLDKMLVVASPAADGVITLVLQDDDLELLRKNKADLGWDDALRVLGQDANITRVELMPAGAVADGGLIYFYDFEDGLIPEGTVIWGGETLGAIEYWGANFGYVFKNAAGGMRSNYLQLPSDIFAKTGDTKEFSISVFVNAADAEGYGWCPLFTAYDSNVAGISCPEFACQYRGVVQVNCNGNDNQGDAWCDYDDYLCDQGKVTVRNWETDWLADKQWHHYAATFTPTKAAVYFDGELLNSWTIDGVSRGQRCEFFGDERFDLFCLGGMQAWGWQDPDPAFAFDDLGLYNKVLSADDIKAIIADKGALTGVESVATVVEGDDAWYNLQGVKVANPTKGIFIHNGKKIVIK